MDITAEISQKKLSEVADELISYIKQNWPSDVAGYDYHDALMDLRHMVVFIQNIMDSAKNDAKTTWDLALFLSKNPLFSEPMEFRCNEAYKLFINLPREHVAWILGRIPTISDDQIANLQDLIAARDSHGFIQNLRSLKKYQSIFGGCRVLYRGQSLWEYVFDNGRKLNDVVNLWWLRDLVERANRFYTSDYYGYKHKCDGMMHNILLMLKYCICEDYRDIFCGKIAKIGALVNGHLAAMHLSSNKSIPTILSGVVEEYMHSPAYIDVYEHLAEEYFKCDTKEQKMVFITSLRIDIDKFDFVMQYLSDYRPKPPVRSKVGSVEKGATRFVKISHMHMDASDETYFNKPIRHRAAAHDMIPLNDLKAADTTMVSSEIDNMLIDKEDTQLQKKNGKNNVGCPKGNWMKVTDEDVKQLVIKQIKVIYPKIFEAVKNYSAKGSDSQSILFSAAILYQTLRHSEIAKDYSERGVSSDFRRAMMDIGCKYRRDSLKMYITLSKILFVDMQDLSGEIKQANALPYNDKGKIFVERGKSKPNFKREAVINQILKRYKNADGILKLLNNQEFFNEIFLITRYNIKALERYSVVNTININHNSQS